MHPFRSSGTLFPWSSCLTYTVYNRTFLKRVEEFEISVLWWLSDYELVSRNSRMTLNFNSLGINQTLKLWASWQVDNLPWWPHRVSQTFNPAALILIFEFSEFDFLSALSSNWCFSKYGILETNKYPPSKNSNHSIIKWHTVYDIQAM